MKMVMAPEMDSRWEELGSLNHNIEKKLPANQECMPETVTIAVKMNFSCVKPLYILHIRFVTAQHTFPNTEIGTP